MAVFALPSEPMALSGCDDVGSSSTIVTSSYLPTCHTANYYGGWPGAGMTRHAGGAILSPPCKKAPSRAGKPGGSRVQSQREDALEEHSKAYASAPSASSPEFNAAADLS
jgi:hypothetical protein